jgi:hypothetical protein
MKDMQTTRINPYGEFPAPLPIPEAAAALAKQDGYTANDTDKADVNRQFPQLRGRFLIDRAGIVRWANIECGTEGLAGAGKSPSEEEILIAAITKLISRMFIAYPPLPEIFALRLSLRFRLGACSASMRPASTSARTRSAGRSRGSPQPPPGVWRLSTSLSRSVPRRWAWAALMGRAFDLDVLACPRCGGRLRLIATVEDSEAIPDALPAQPQNGTRTPISP